MTDDMWMGKQSYVSIKIQLKAWKSQQKSLYKTAIKLDACETTVKDIQGKKSLKNSKRILSADCLSTAFKFTGRKEGKLEGTAQSQVR